MRHIPDFHPRVFLSIELMINSVEIRLDNSHYTLDVLQPKNAEVRASKSQKIDDYFLSPNTFKTNEGIQAYKKIADRVRKIKGQK